MDIDLTGKIAVVTGATGQLGRVMARTFASCGADVAVCYAQNAAMADTLVNEITGMGRRAVAAQVDVTSETSVNAMRDVVKSSLGDADIVVNNAVIQYDWKFVLKQDPDDFRSQFDSCVMQSVFTAKAFLPAMQAKGGGRFIGINSECSLICGETMGAYAAGKRGMDGLYRVLAHEAGKSGVTVNQVAPGWTISDKDCEHPGDAAPAYIDGVPMGRRGTDQEIANVVLFLASELASFVTGVLIPVCGGAVMA